MFFPDYLFYKFASWFFKNDGEGGSRAGMAVSIMYLCVLWDITVYVLYRLKGGAWIDEHLKYLTTCVCLVLVTIVCLNYYRYRNKFKYLESKWKDDSPLISGIKTFTSMAAYFLILFLSIKITHDLPF